MEKFLASLTALFRHEGFMFFFWAFLASPLALWPAWYFHRRKVLSQAELVKISNEFEGINFSYMGFSILIILPLLFFSVMLFPAGAMVWLPLLFGIRLFPLMFVIFASYGVGQALFAIFMGVYPMGKSMSYIYDDKAAIYRAAKLQIAVSLGIYAVLFILATWLS